jgi:EAL domain-containing protein (putative c-di-GMP-specific phosphodiesterase class I)
MSETECILLVDDDSGITDALSFALERPGRKIVICSDVDAAEIALSRFPVTHLVTDVQFSGLFGFEGLHFLGRVRALAPRCTIVLMTGYASDELRGEAISHGASAVLAKPFAVDELERVLGGECAAGASEASDAEHSQYDVIRIPAIDEVLRGDALTPVFQPIVRVKADGVETFGYEALTRVQGRWLIGGPAMLFEYAARRNKLAELNVVAVARSIEAAAGLPANSTIFINVDPLAFGASHLVNTLVDAASRASISLRRVVLEVTERSAFADDEAAARVFDELRALGVRFALDDHGSAYSHLSLISRIRPSFIKMSQTFGTDFESDDTKARIVRHTVALARDFGCETILEGVETPGTADAAVAAGVTLAQGFHFGRPSAARHWLTADVSPRAA